MKSILLLSCAALVAAVMCGSAFKNKGIQPLLDAVLYYLPAPTDVPHIKGIDPDTNKEEECIAGDDQPFAALAFKIQTDPHVGKLVYFRVYSGVVTGSSYILNSTKGNRERVGRLLQMHAIKGG